MMHALDRTIENLIARLLERRTSAGCWEGYLSSSALSTATAVSALSLATNDNIDLGLNWLATNQNADGGWGDTVLSRSNISTTLLCWCCFSITSARERYQSTVSRAEAWLEREAGSLEPLNLTQAILDRYGRDRTFSVPILTVMAIAGKLGDGRDGWREIPQLPFELAALPHQLFGWLSLPVVSYALPALIAIGQVRHHHRPSSNPALRLARNSLSSGTLKLLGDIQPSTGGYLEATPLTSFVVMSLAAAEQKHHGVVTNGVRFLRSSMREDGSWPIDTNLSTWVTTLSVDALAALPAGQHPLDSREQRTIRDWLLAQQYREEHPYTHAAPGGWAWTPLPGSVPDADDTAGALLALRNLGPVDDDVRHSAQRGLRWLLDLRNRDGGMPTFCRGWGALPFDCSAADLTAHAISAWHAWLPELQDPLRSEVQRAIAGSKAYLARVQKADGSWMPLWFGNEHTADDHNLTYGTARVSIALSESDGALQGRARQWLRDSQNADGGWGGGPKAPSSVEETALAIHALAGAPGADSLPALSRGVEWLIEATASGARTPVSPIGLYFARLWYFEELYPLIFATGAAIRARAALGLYGRAATRSEARRA
jgi:squalene-hopene/tetraprenyl-beta-curcumene cyclase